MKRAAIRTCLIVLLTAVLETSSGLRAQASPQPETVVITELSDTKLAVSVDGATAVTYTTTVADLWQFSLNLPGLVLGAAAWAEPGDSTTGKTDVNLVGIASIGKGMVEVGAMSDLPVSLPTGAAVNAN